MASVSGQAEIVNFVTTLHVALDLRNVPAGQYRLAVRRDGDAWSFYRRRCGSSTRACAVTRLHARD
jgi:hypothetical protein